MNLIWSRPHNEVSFCNYRLKLALKQLLPNLHKMICFSQGQLSSAEEKRTNTEFQILLLFTLASNSRRYYLFFNAKTFSQCYFLPIVPANFFQGEFEIQLLK